MDNATTAADTGINTTTATAVLAEANRLLTGDRAAAYGDPTVNFKRIAALWSAYLAMPIFPRDVAWLMVLLKVSREAHGPHTDNAIDIAAYAALAEQVN